MTQTLAGVYRGLTGSLQVGMLDKAEEAQHQVLLETCPSLAREERSSLAQTEMYRVGLIAAAVYSRAPGRTWL